ncbi:NYN domain-containing protein [Desulfurivibrio sp. D14AmB]|uniref:NYN domain-containing protein n=1 Tax=Desulfurivibrio sp. D14AmB TaxID=3374370 RepID=UPI00376F1987
MERFAIFVDAGYFYSAGAYAITNSQIPRRKISLPSASSTIKDICERGARQSSSPALLRVYWYDAMMGPRLSMEQSNLAHLAGVKVRLGSLNNAGEQKGVDSLIVTDLIELARNGAITDAILVSGDEDLRIAVQLAQTYGVRVHILAVGDAEKNVSQTLKMEADSLQSLDVAWLKQHLSITITATETALPAAPVTIMPGNTPSEKSLEDAAHVVCEELIAGAEESNLVKLVEHLKASTVIPPEFDGKLIAKTAAEIKRRLTSDEKRKIRGLFVTTLREKYRSATPS